jgi:hypothetical protein
LQFEKQKYQKNLPGFPNCVSCCYKSHKPDGSHGSFFGLKAWVISAQCKTVRQGAVTHWVQMNEYFFALKGQVIVNCPYRARTEGKGSPGVPSVKRRICHRAERSRSFAAGIIS